MTSRRIGVGLTVLMLLGIGAATLTPASGVSTAGPWCIACGDLGGVDLLANIVLFVPLGVGIALATRTLRWPVLASLAFTLVIEGLQLRVIPGRDASLGDVLANTLGGCLGGVLGYWSAYLLQPRRRLAAMLALAWALLLSAGFTVTSWGFAALPAPLSLWIQHTPERAGFDNFPGVLESFRLDSLSLADQDPPRKKPIAEALARRQWRAVATVRVDAASDQQAVIARIAEEAAIRLSVEQAGTQLRCRVRTRASGLRLREPMVALDDALAPTAGQSVAVTCGRLDDRLIASATRDGRTRAYELPLSPGIGWVLASPFTIPLDERLTRLGLVWMLVLGLPLGYWLAAAAGRESHAHASDGGTRIAAACTAGVGLLLLVSLVVTPRLFDVTPATVAEWAALLGGIAGGAVVQRAAYRER